MRLIDADALMKTIRTYDYPLKSHLNSTDDGMFTVGIKQAVDEQPTIDAVEVVRCKDCKHWCNEIDEHTYECCTRAIVNRFKPADYCSYGERKEE